LHAREQRIAIELGNSGPRSKIAERKTLGFQPWVEIPNRHLLVLERNQTPRLFRCEPEGLAA
jgi:hypothetical protein